MAPLLAVSEDPVAVLTLDEVLSPYVYVFYAAFIVAFLFTPIMRVVAMHYGIVDKPDGVRKIHREPIAYLGGVAVFLGWLAGLSLSHFLTLHKGPADAVSLGSPRVPFAIALAGIVIVVVGLIDDVKGMKPWMKIGGQVLAALILLVQGVGTHAMGPILGNFDERLQLSMGHFPPVQYYYVPEWVVVSSSAVLVVMLVVFCCNASNLMDGMDGLCGGVTSIISLGYVFLALHVAQGGTQFSTNTDALRIIISLALLGAVLGFVPYNFNPASIFMGDTGSMFLGFSIATMMVLLGEVASKWLLAALVMFSLPTLDTALAFVRRYIAGRPFFSADKHHIHHQFLARGLSVKQTVLFLYGSSIFFVLLAALIAFMRTRYAVALDLVVFGCIIVAAYKMGMVHERVTTAVKPNPIGADETIVPVARGAGGTLEIPDAPYSGVERRGTTGDRRAGANPALAGVNQLRASDGVAAAPTYVGPVLAIAASNGGAGPVNGAVSSVAGGVNGVPGGLPSGHARPLTSSNLSEPPTTLTPSTIGLAASTPSGEVPI